jgi:hypothetical protein
MHQFAVPWTICSIDLIVAPKQSGNREWTRASRPIQEVRTLGGCLITDIPLGSDIILDRMLDSRRGDSMWSHRWYVCVLVFCVLAGSVLTVPLMADDTVPWLTGTFDVLSFGPNPGFGENSAYFYVPPIGVGPAVGSMSFTPPANLPHTSFTYCYAWNNCSWYTTFTTWDGSAVGGTTNFVAGTEPDDTFLTMAGWMTDGGIQGREVVSCTPFCAYAERNWAFSYTFRGVWSNGWWSEGYVTVGLFGDELAASGVLEMTTHTPEPGTLGLIGAGLVPVCSILRRRLHRHR